MCSTIFVEATIMHVKGYCYRYYKGFYLFIFVIICFFPIRCGCSPVFFKRPNATFNPIVSHHLHPPHHLFRRCLFFTFSEEFHCHCFPPLHHHHLEETYLIPASPPHHSRSVDVRHHHWLKMSHPLQPHVRHHHTLHVTTKLMLTHHHYHFHVLPFPRLLDALLCL